MRTPLPSADHEETRTHDTYLLREVRAFCTRRRHLNPFFLSSDTSLAEKRFAGSRPLSYEDAVSSIRVARREGSKRGTGPHMAAVMVNAIILDSLAPGESPDLVAVPCEPFTATPKKPELAERDFARAQSELHVGLAECIAEGHISEAKAGELRRLKARVDREFDVMLFSHQEGSNP